MRFLKLQAIQDFQWAIFVISPFQGETEGETILDTEIFLNY